MEKMPGEHWAAQLVAVELPLSGFLRGFRLGKWDREGQEPSREMGSGSSGVGGSDSGMFWFLVCFPGR